MAYLIVIYSKYFITLFLALFGICGIWALRYRSVVSQRRAANLQCVFLFLVQFGAYLTVVIRTQRMEYLIFYAFLQVLTLAVPILAAFLYPGTSRILWNHMCMLLTVGLIILTRLDLSKAKKQLLIAAFSFTAALAVPWMMKKTKKLRSFGWLYGAVGIAALSAVLVLGQVTHGSKLSYAIAGITFQPSEFVKILYVFFLAALLGQDTGIRQVFLTGIGAALHVGILVLSRDLGTALIFCVVYVLMIVIATHKIWYLAAGGAAGAAASVLAYRLFSHVQVRVQAWKDPWSVIDDQGFQITQSLFALSRGGMFGLGIGKGTPQDIPFVETDFVFAAVVEEMGLLFGIGTALAAVVLFLLIVRLAAGMRDGFYRNLAVGFGMLFCFQTFLTIGGGTKFIPLTGVTLPFISYGGSSLMATALMCGVVQGIFEMRYDEEMRFEKQRRKRKEQDSEAK